MQEYAGFVPTETCRCSMWRGGWTRLMTFSASSLPVTLLLIAVMLVGGIPSGAASPPREYQVKAAFLYNFARFTEWPGGTFAKPKDPLTICVLGQDPFGPDLEETVKG